MVTLNNLVQGFFGTQRLKAGDFFGNLYQSKFQNYTPQWIIAMT